MRYSYDRNAGYEKESASPAELEEMPDDRKKFVKDLGLTPVQVFDGIHGWIIVMKVSHGEQRLTRDTLKKYLKYSFFRWVSCDASTMSIGL